MAAQTELESMIVRLIGDGSSYKRMLEQAQVASEIAAKQIETAGRRIEGFNKSINTFASSALSALGLLGASSFLKNAFNSFTALETVQTELSAAIQANGGNVEATMASYKEYVQVLTDTRNISKVAGFELLKMAEALGQTGHNAEQAVQTALNLSAAWGGSPQQYIRISQALRDGNTAMFGRIMQLRGVKGEQEKMQKVIEAINRGEAINQTIMGTTKGVMDRFNLTVRGLTAQFGELVALGVKPFFKWVTDLIKPLTKLDEVNKRIVFGLMLFSAAILSIGPGLAIVTKYLNPIVRLMFSGFSLLGRTLLLLANPLAVIGIAFRTIVFFLSPFSLAIGAIGIFIALLIDKLGGLKVVWENVRVWAVGSWEYIKNNGGEMWIFLKRKSTEFFNYIQPAITVMRSLFGLAWEAVKEYGTLAWNAIKSGAVDTFVWIQKVAKETYTLSVAFISTNRSSILATAAMIGMGIAIYGLIRGFIALRTLLLASIIYQTTVNSLWIAYGFIVGTVNGVIALFNFQLAVWRAILTSANIATALWVVLLTGAAIGMGVLKTVTIAYSAIMLISKGIMIAWTAVVYLFNTGITAMDVLFGILLGVTTVYSGAVSLLSFLWGVATVAAGALTAAVSALDIAMGAAVFLAAIGTVIALYAAWMILSGAVMSAFYALRDTFNVLGSMPKLFGPLAAIGGLFSQWYSILMDVLRAAETDMPLAWELMKKGAELAIQQIKDLWEPLWKFIRDGFKETARYVALNFLNRFDAVLEEIQIRMTYTNAFMGLTKQGQKELDKLKLKSALTALDIELNFRVAMQNIANGFGNRAGPSEKAKKLQEEFNKLREKIGNPFKPEGDFPPDELFEQQRMLDQAKRQAEKFGQEVGQAEVKGHHSATHAGQSSIFGSVEARKAIEAYRTAIDFAERNRRASGSIVNTENTLGMNNAAAVRQFTPAEARAQARRSIDERIDAERNMADILNRIADGIDALNEKDPVELDGADIA